MRQQVKRYSRSALSILLTLCMLVSCMTVGIIATDAATITNIGYANVKGEMLANGDWSSSRTTYPMSGDGNYYSVTLLLKAGYEYIFVLNIGKENDWDADFGKTGAYFDTASETETSLVSGQEMKVKAISSSTGYVNATIDFYGEHSNDSRITVSQTQASAPTPYLHYCIGDDGRQFSQNSATNVAMTSAGGDTYTYSLSEAGSYHVNIDGNSGQSGTALGITSVSAGAGITGVVTADWGGYNFYNFTTPGPVTLSFNKSTKVLTITLKASTVSTAVSPSGVGTAYVSKTSTVGAETSVTNVDYGSNVYLKATVTDSDYEFSSWKAVSGLEYESPGSNTTNAKATADATATAIFLPKKYGITKQNSTHIKVNVPTEARWGSSVTPTATAEPGYKVDKFQWWNDSEWHDLTPGSSFTMPKHDVIVKAVETTCATHTVTFSTTTGNGSIRAVTDDGRTITSGGLVNTGSVVTFTAVPADEATFTSWGGDLSGSVSPKSLTVNADKNVTASFGDNTYFVASYTSSTYNANAEAYSTVTMSRLNNGYYRSSTKLSNNKFFTVGKTAGSTTTYAKCGQDEPWGISNVTPAVTPQHWTSNKTMKSKYQNTIGEDSYVFYDPETDKIWLSSDPAGFTGVTIFAKDGSLVAHNPGAGITPGTTCGWGDTTLTVTAGGSNKAVTDVFDSQVHKATLTDAEVQASTTSVTVSTTSSKSGYYVYGFDVNGITIQAENGSATFCPADLDCNISNFIEITPIYMLTDPSLTDPNAKPTTIRFYVRSFAGEIESLWGGELYCYAYENEDIRTNGNWPGQPMINLGGGTYYMDLPINTKGITLSNAAADWVHATTMGIGLPLNNEQQSWDNRNAYQCQSYDYDDFQYIYAKPGVGENDEDIIFDFKYKQGDWGTAGKDNFPNNQFEYNNGHYSETGFPENLEPSNSSYQWEEYTDFYGNPVDLWGTRLTSNYNNNPVRIVVQGYYDTTGANSSYYATTYVVYEPDTPTGANPSYSIVKYTSNNMTDYGKLSRSEFLQRSAEDMGLTGLAGQPVEITYEYAIYKNMSTKGTHPINQTNQYAERADGVWYYSETKPVKAKIKIQYADKLYGTYTDDTFEIDTDHPGTDYDGDPYTVNEGTVTKGKAYFIDNNVNNANRPTGAPFDVNYTNRTVEFAYSDGNEHYELQAEESPDGEYTFVGWYKETSNGLDKCPPGFTYSMEATTNETFIARYVKAPSGIKLAHKPVVNGKGGNGNREVKYEIYNNADLTGDPLKTGEANGSIVVDKKYIKYNQNYYLKVTYEVVPDGNSLPNGIYSTGTQAPENLISEAGFEAHNTYNSKHVDVDGFALTPTGTATTNTTKVEFKVPINAFFKQITGTNDYEFDEDLALLELFSDFDRIRNSINITKTVDYNNGETFSFTVKALNDHDTPDDSNDDTWDDYVGKYTVGDDPTEHSFTGTISNVSGNQTIHIVDAPAGTVFQISEVDPATGTAYNFTSVTIDGATATDDIPKGKQFTMPNDDSVNMEFTNTIKKADVKVKKVVVDGNSGTQKFPITLIYTAPGAATTTKTVNLGHDETTTGTDILTLPVGTTITVSEDLTDISGYAEAYTISGTNISQNGNTFTVTAQPSDTDALITVTNKKLHNLKITKTTNVDNTTDQFTFKAYYKNTSADSWTAINENIQIVKGGTWTSPGKYKTGTLFKVEEVVPAKYSYNASGSSVSNSTGTAITNGFENITMGTEDVTVTVNNTVNTKTVTISKTADYTESASGAFTFNVKTKAEGASNASNCTYSYKLAGEGDYLNFTDGNVTLTSGQSIVIYNVPVDTEVTVQETNAGTATSTTAVISNAKSGTGSYNSDTKTATFTVGSEANPSVEFTNSKDKTLTITKAKPSGDSDVNDTTTPFYFEVRKTAGGGDFDGAYTLSNLAAGKETTGRWDATNNRYTVYMGETITISVQSAEIYTIKEVAIPANYTLTSVTGDGVDINESSKTVGKTVTIGISNASVTFENSIKRANVTVQKLVPDYNSGNDKFPITVSYTKPGMAAATTTYNLKKNDIGTALTLPYGTHVTVSENLTDDMAKKYQLATDGIKYTVTGETQQTGASFNMTDKNVAVTVTNERKPYTVNVVKVVEGDNADSTAFTVNVNGTDQTITQSTSCRYTAYYGDTVTISETNLPRGYELVSISDGARTGTSYSSTVTGNTNVTVTNRKLPTYDVTVTKKVVEGTADSTEFGVSIQTNNTPYSYAVNGGSVTAVNDGASTTVSLEHNQSVIVSGLLVGETLTVTETDDGDPDYAFVNFTVNGTSEDGSDKSYEYTVTNDANQNISVNNKEVAKYQFEIKYIYESYSAKTYNDDTAHNDDNRVVGENRSYTQTGEISREDLDTFFDKDAEGKLSFKNDTDRKNFINKFAPYEDDFMLNLVWNDSNPKAATYDASTKTIMLETKATSETARTVRVKVKMPWSNGAYVAEPETTLYTTQYGDHVYDTDGSLLTAPQTLNDNGTTMYFKYWQIKTDYDKKDKNYSDTNSKRCYYDSFNMTMYQDSYVEAVYGTTETSFNPSAQSYADTENGEARIAFMETSRNQWNNNGDPVTNKLAGDRIYTDFQLTFGYQDILLNTAAGSGIKTGFVMEQVALLDKVGDKFVTQTESEYKTRYDGDADQKTARENAVKAYIADKNKSTYTDTLGTHTFKLNSNIALTTLDNKNQCKHSVDMSNKVLRGDNLEEGTLKNYVYRAYTYIQLSDGSIVLSDPVYFTIYDVATINNGTTN